MPADLIGHFETDDLCRIAYRLDGPEDAGCCAAIRDMDLRPTARLISARTLVIAGSEDPSTSMADGQWLADRIQDARLVVLEAAHLSNVERADQFSAALLDFLLG